MRRDISMKPLSGVWSSLACCGWGCTGADLGELRTSCKIECWLVCLCLLLLVMVVGG